MVGTPNILDFYELEHQSFLTRQEPNQGLHTFTTNFVMGL